MTTLEQGYKILIGTIVNKEYHKHYKRVTELAKLYKQLISGCGIDELLKRFVPREEAVMFEQRVNITQQITPSVASTIINPFYKVPRVNSIIEKIDFVSTEGQDEKRKNLLDALEVYNGSKSLKGYMDKRFVEMSFTDPNGFIVTEFDQPELGASDEMLGKVSPRPFEVSSWEAVNYEYENGILQWLVVKLGCNYMNTTLMADLKSYETKMEVGEAYTIYLDDTAIRYTQVDNNKFKAQQVGVVFQTTDGTNTFTYFRANEKQIFLVEEFIYNAGKVPAKRIGYKNDLVTDGETYVNPLHDALPYFMKSIKTVSEFDLTMALHAFPQKFQYVARCQGTSSVGCSGGETPDGGKCGVCQGRGTVIHTSTQDSVTLPIPKDTTQIMDLQKLVYYASPPIDLVKFQDEFIFQLKNEARQAVFNSEIFNKADVMQTATEMRISLESVYDTLFPFAEAYSDMYKYIVSIVAQFRDIKDVIVIHKFPKDFKFKTVSDLLLELKQANESNAPGYVRQELSLDIAEQQFVDKPEELKRIRIKQKYFPFPDKTQSEIIYIVSNGLATEFDKILWANFDNIFSELEADADELGNYFYDYTTVIQKEKIKEKVNLFIEEISANETIATTLTGADNSGGVAIAGDSLGKIPLALQQLALARERANTAGDKELAKQIGDKMDELLASI